jgi:hypothetical protein
MAVRLLSYKEAVKEFPELKEDDFTWLVTGTRKEVRAALRVQKTTVGYFVDPVTNTEKKIFSKAVLLKDDEAVEELAAADYCPNPKEWNIYIS